MNPKCMNCFCNDLCGFLVNRTGVATTCSDFQNRVRVVVEREIEKKERRKKIKKALDSLMKECYN